MPLMLLSNTLIICIQKFGKDLTASAPLLSFLVLLFLNYDLHSLKDTYPALCRNISYNLVEAICPTLSYRVFMAAQLHQIEIYWMYI